MSEQISNIIDQIEYEAADMRGKQSLWTWIANKRRKRTHFRFRYRVIIAALIFMMLLLSYTLMFIHGNTLGSYLNNWTDSVVAPAFTWIMTSIGAFFGRDWSDMGGTFARLSTFGPLSFIVVAAVISFAVSAIIAFAYSHGATKHSRNDGTPNFLAEQRKLKEG